MILSKSQNLSMEEGYVQSEQVKEGLLKITFFHPKHNALPSQLLNQLEQAIQHAGLNPEVRLIILQSGGDRTFCAGASFDELKAIETLEQGKTFFKGFANVINACRKCSKLIIGRVQGKAVGGGVGLAAAMDYCLASKYAAIKLSELNIGIGPFVIGPAVERKMGLAAFSQLSINAETFKSAEWAVDKGLYTEVFDDIIQLNVGVDRIAHYLLSKSPKSQAKLKRMFWDGCDDWDDLLDERAAISGELVLSDFAQKTLKTL